MTQSSISKVIFYKPHLEDLWFRQAMMADPETMSYNQAWGGIIPFQREKWADWYDSYDILNLTIKGFADFSKYLRGYVAAFAHLGNSVGSESCSFSEIFLLHVFINQKFPELIVVHIVPLLCRVPIFIVC